MTLLDGRQMQSNIDSVQADQPLEMLGMRMHLLPAGNQYPLGDGADALPRTLAQAVRLLAAVEPAAE